MRMDATLHNRDGAWVLTLEREFAHPPEVVWPWLTDPERLARWSPIVPDRPLDAPGARRVRENPGDEPVDGEVLSVDPPRELVHRWGEDLVRWRLSATAVRLPTDVGTDHAATGSGRDERRGLGRLPHRAR